MAADEDEDEDEDEDDDDDDDGEFSGAWTPETKARVDARTAAGKGGIILNLRGQDLEKAMREVGDGLSVWKSQRKWARFDANQAGEKGA